MNMYLFAMGKPKKEKTFTKLGQILARPKKDDPLRRFYTSLYKQNPKSKMAMTWMLERGLFSPKKTQAILAELRVDSLTISDSK